MRTAGTEGVVRWLCTTLIAVVLATSCVTVLWRNRPPAPLPQLNYVETQLSSQDTGATIICPSGIPYASVAPSILGPTPAPIVASIPVGC